MLKRMEKEGIYKHISVIFVEVNFKIKEEKNN